jgi:hypothetical protein
LEDRFLKTFKNFRRNLREICRGVLPLSKKVGGTPLSGLTPLLMIVKIFHKGNAHGGRPTVIKVRK